MSSHALGEAKTQMNVCEKELTNMEGENQRAEKRVAACDLESRKLEQKLTRHEKDKLSARRALSTMLEKVRSVTQQTIRTRDRRASPSAGCLNHVRYLLMDPPMQYPWIETEKHFFGRRHTDYDFDARDAGKAQHLLRKLEDEQHKLVKKINKKVWITSLGCG